MNIKNRLLRFLVHIVFPVKRAQYKELKKFAENIENKNILEIGSGSYCIDKFFDESNNFTKTDINSKYGHPIIDVTKMNQDKKYDIIICLNVLEHVFDFNKGIKNMYNCLKDGGILFLSVPVFYPFHDEPNDYWRFTEHSMKKVLADFSNVKIKRSGIKQFPYNYNIICHKD